MIADEPMASMDLNALVGGLGHRGMHVSCTRDDAVAAVGKRAPGLVLADIHLADGSSGLDSVNQILERCDVTVVFITAYPERPLMGERPEPAFLITKPIRTEMVQAVISQALFFDHKAQRCRPPRHRRPHRRGGVGRRVASRIGEAIAKLRQYAFGFACHAVTVLCTRRDAPQRSAMIAPGMGRNLPATA